MRFEELAPGDLAGLELGPLSGEARLQYGTPWLALTGGAVAETCGPGARLSVLAASDEEGLLAAVPMVRTSLLASPRPFPFDAEDLFFGLWIRSIDPADRALRARASLSRAFAALLGRVSPSLHRGLILHAPLSPASEGLAARRLDPARAREAVSLVHDEARRIAAVEGRCALIPRVERREAATWDEIAPGWTRVPSYANAFLSPLEPLPGRIRQMIRRNARLLERAEVVVEISREAPHGFPFGALFAATAARHRDPAPRLDDTLFQKIAACVAPRARFLCARRGGRPVGFLAVLEHGASWEAWKCGVDRALAGQAPVYLHLLYGLLPELAARQGIARVDLGPGDLDVKRRYGARLCPVDALLALPPRFRLRGAFEAYVHAVGEGIAARNA